jgi:fatty acid desaturase
MERDIFEMVNNHERQEAIRRRYSEKRKRNNLKIVNWAVAFGFVSLFFSLMAVTGCMIVWVAFPLCTFFGMLSAFTAGRWFENGKCWGWF